MTRDKAKAQKLRRRPGSIVDIVDELDILKKLDGPMSPNEKAIEALVNNGIEMGSAITIVLAISRAGMRIVKKK